MGKNYTLYINIDNFAKEGNKSGLVNQLLASHYAGQVFEPEDAPLKPRPMTEVMSDAEAAEWDAAERRELDLEEEDEYPGYKIHRLTGQVVDTINQEQVYEVDKEMIDYLKKNNRYV